MRAAISHTVFLRWGLPFLLAAVGLRAGAQEEHEQSFGTVAVEGRMKGVIFADGIPGSETITRTGLAKMACCTVAESFENSASVTVGYADAVSGTRQLRLLGLGGAYTQVLDESRPVLRGLGAPYALSLTPGVWLSSLQISKGTSSVAAGHDAITGQINLEHRKPTDAERLFVNFYLDDMLRPEFNLASAFPLTQDKRLSTVLLLHGAADTEWREMGAMDLNGDHFRDLPRNREASLASKWLWADPVTGLQMRWGGKYSRDARLGGMMHFSSASAARREMKQAWADYTAGGATSIAAYPHHYASNIDNENANAYLKAALPFGPDRADSTGREVVRSSVALVADFDHWGEAAFFGLNAYGGNENSVFLNLMVNHYFRSDRSLACGVQGHFSHIRESLLNPQPWVGREGRFISEWQENELGAYAEYTFSAGEMFSVVAGLRGDYNWLYRRAYLTPRFHLKWQVAPQTTLRASAGLGYRTPHVLTENIGMLATGRTVDISPEALAKPERALTTGVSLMQKFYLFGHLATLSADYFYTRFGRNIVVDQELDAHAIVVYASDRPAYTHTVQADFSFTPLSGLDLYAAFRLNATQQYRRAHRGDDVSGVTWLRSERPLTDRYKALFNVQYYTHFRRWVFDATVQLNGPSRVPGDPYAQPATRSWHSPAYFQLFAQVSHKVGRFEFYLGCENILDYRQSDPILHAGQPFTEAFNSLNVWGPLMGRKIYAGLRFNLY